MKTSRPKYKIGDRFGVWEVIGYLTNNCLTVYYLYNNLNQGKLTVDEDTLTRIFGVVEQGVSISNG